jgi:hypothetical protein
VDIGDTDLASSALVYVFANLRLSPALDDHDHVFDAQIQGIVDRVIHQRRATRPDLVELLETAVARADPGGKNYQRRLHCPVSPCVLRAIAWSAALKLRMKVKYLLSRLQSCNCSFSPP